MNLSQYLFQLLATDHQRRLTQDRLRDGGRERTERRWR
jgi:hypothetical protein